MPTFPSMDAVYASILENLRAIELVNIPTVDAFKKDRTNTSDSKEITVKEFIERYLPADYRVKRGIIYSQDAESHNIDCVVLSPIHPALATPVREVMLAEGVYAAVEVKPDISVLTEGGELLRGLKQIKSVKNLKRTVEAIDLSRLLKTPQRPEYFNKIPSVIFSFKSTSIEDTINFLISKIKDGTLASDELPDMIVTLDKGVISYTPHLSFSALGQQMPQQQREALGERVFIHFGTTEKDVVLVMFLLIFLTFTPPSTPPHRFIINDYLQKLNVNFTTKVYPVELNTPKAVQFALDTLMAKQQPSSDQTNS